MMTLQLTDVAAGVLESIFTGLWERNIISQEKFESLWDSVAEPLSVEAVADMLPLVSPSLSKGDPREFALLALLAAFVTAQKAEDEHLSR